MNKDVIYIDVEDDITTIVGKIKASKEKIVALVPPNRVGVLQSAVNMRLLARTAEHEGKRIVLISHNQSLMALAAAARIPVARNLQSKPELAEIPVLKVDGDDVIDGETLPVGEHADTVSRGDDTAVAAVIADNSEKKTKKADANKKKTKVPNFSSFRKRIVLIGSGVAVLIAFFVWALWFAPRATVVITAKTTPATVDRNVQLLLDGDTNVENGTLRVVKQEQKQEISVDFTATDQKNVGDKATGRIRFSTSQSSSRTVPAGTVLTAGGFNFALSTAVTVSAAILSFECGGICPGVAEGSIAAAEGGANYNGVSGAVSGAPSGVSVTLVGSTSGGTDKMATVVGESDIAQAATLLEGKKADTLRDKLTSSFASSSVAIADSYSETRSDPTPSVAVGSEASGTVVLRATVTATMLAVDQSQLSTFIRDSLTREIDGKANQKIYDDGLENVKFTQFSNRSERIMVRVTANGKIGPEINEDQVKEQARGKRYGDIQSSLEAIEGVNEVDTQFWPFWVRTVPDDSGRITVEFKFENAS